ncbi:MAG: hypothetical protein IPI33_15560, partial [Dehalococcoidia bacterium]|nr:hypothetical protein [Dehalococcoidia bacterium]
MKTSLRAFSLFAALVALATPAFAAVYAPIEDAELLRRAGTVVVARATGSTVVAMPGGLPETRTAFTVVDTLSGSDAPYVEVAVPGGELPGGLALALEGVPRFTPGALYVLALNVRADGALVPTELGLGAFDVVRDEAGRDYATRAMFRSERVAVLQREADGSLSERAEPLRELAAFTSYVRAELYRTEAVPGVPAYVVARETGSLQQVRQGGVSALWDDHWCPSGVPGSCGTAFDRYRWVDTTATVRFCDEDPANFGQGGVPGGGSNEFQNAIALWVNDPNSLIRYTYAAPAGGTCNPAAIPAAGTVPVYFDNLSMFGGADFRCPFTTGGLLAIGGVVTDQSTHAFKGTSYRTIRAGIGWARRANVTCQSGNYPLDLFQTVMANVLGSTLGLTSADKTRNPNDLDPADDRFALMLSSYATVPSPFLGSDDRAAICYLYGDCVGLPAEAKFFVPFVGRVTGQGGSVFSSEMALTNRSEKNSTVTIEYLPSIGAGKGTVTEPVAAGHQVIIPDVISYLRDKGLVIAETGDAAGTLRVTFGSVYAFDASVTVRTATAVPRGVTPAVGRAGLAYLGVSQAELMLDPAWLLGLRASSTDRSNIALQNAGADADGSIRLRATWYSNQGVPGGTPVERTLAPGAWSQFDLATLEPAAAEGYVKVELVEGRVPWYAYGVVNDMVNSDGSFIAPLADQVIKARETLILPVAVEAGPYTTEIILDNVSTTAKTARLKWVADGLTAESVSLEYPLPAGRQLVIFDWVQTLRNAGLAIPAEGARLAGAVFVTVPDGTVSGVSISARVLNLASDVAAKATDLGFYGVHYPAATKTCLANQASWLGGLRQDDENRTNIAIVNTGEVDGSSSTYRVEVFDGDLGTKAGETEVMNLPYERFIQIDRALMQIAPGVKNAFVRVTALSGPNPFITYAVVNDGSEPGKRSGDGAYIPSE